MKPFKLLLICSALALAGCGDKGDADKTEGKAEGESLIEQAQDVTGQAMEEAKQAASDAGAAMEQAAETAQDETAAAVEQAGEAADAAAAGAADMADEAATAADEAVAAGSAAVTEAAGGDAPAPAAEAETEADLAVGQSVYQSKCLACHATGAAGAPKMGDKADWEPRIAQGMDTLVKHAIEGFKGAKGYMPPKGGFTSLSDDEVKAAVAYMVKENS